MAAIKTKRISAGRYAVNVDGAHVGYIMNDSDFRAHYPWRFSPRMDVDVSGFSASTKREIMASLVATDWSAR